MKNKRKTFKPNDSKVLEIQNKAFEDKEDAAE